MGVVKGVYVNGNPVSFKESEGPGPIVVYLLEEIPLSDTIEIRFDKNIQEDVVIEPKDRKLRPQPRPPGGGEHIKIY